MESGLGASTESCLAFDFCGHLVAWEMHCPAHGLQHRRGEEREREREITRQAAAAQQPIFERYLLYPISDMRSSDQGRSSGLKESDK